MAAAAPPAIDVEALKERLLYDTPFYAEHLLKIVDKARRTVALKGKAAQLRFDRAMEEQREAGIPVRAIVLKARQIGFSTWTQGKIMQRITQRPNRDALVIAQDTKTAGKLFDIGHRMHRYLPVDPQLPLKPEIKNYRKSRFLHFATVLESGDLWPDSTLTVDTANEFEAGRGQTYSEVHCSELAFWPDIDRKLLGVLEAVPDEPETMVVLESTANGFNEWKDLWDQAEQGENGYVPFFSPWFEDPSYSRPFLDAADREDFLSTLDDYEQGLLERSPYEEARAEPLTPEQLHWRRWKLNTPPINGDLDKWNQEYPDTPLAAFIATGKQVFKAELVKRVVQRTEETDPRVPTEERPGPKVGILKPAAEMTKKGRHGEIRVITKVEWVPREATGFGSRYPFWKVWEEPQPDAAYIAILDPSGADIDEGGEPDYHGIQVINHRTRQQVASYRSRIDPDLAGRELYMALLHWNHAICVVERTGGWGLSIIRRIYFDYRYPRHLTYFQRRAESQREKEEDRLGWNTSKTSKPLIEDLMTELLRERGDGIRCRLTAHELTTYVKDSRGRTGAEKGKFDDLLMPYMIGQQVAQEMRPRSESKAGKVRSMLDPDTAKRWMVTR